jgi:hypothetical protein
VRGRHADVEAVLSRIITNFEMPRTTLRQNIAQHTEASGTT